MSDKIEIHDPLVGACAWVKKALPEPKEKDRSTQLGVFLEEVSETLVELTAEDADVALVIKNAVTSLSSLARYVKTNGGVYIAPENRIAFLDGLCDIIQTAASTAHANQLDLVGGMGEVVASNFSKFVGSEPVFDANRKIQKGPDYFKPNLMPFV